MERNTITVNTVDNSFLQLDTEPSIARELSDYFSFMTPNYRFMPAYKNGFWDGKTRLYKIMGSVLPSGLYQILLKFASDNEYEVIDARLPSSIEKPVESHIDPFLSELDISTDGKRIEHYDYQVEAIKQSIMNERATILSATSSGKSLNIYSLVRWYMSRVKGKILILVPTVNLVTQLFTDFEDYASLTDWSTEDNVHTIHQGKKKNSEKKVYISTWQSVYKMPKEYFEQFDVVMCDEVHLASASSIIRIMESSINASVRIGFTGTLKDTQLHQLTIVSLFGDIKRCASSHELIDRGVITPIDIKFIMLKHDKDSSKEINRKVVESVSRTGKKTYRNNYQNELDHIIQHSNRNKFICNLASVLKGNVLILFTKVEKHGKPLYNLINHKLGKEREVKYISGETKSTNREIIRQSVEDDDNSILIASYGTLSTGVNIKSLQYVIFASPYKSEIKVLQSIGRVLRKKEGKTKSVLFDLVDDMRYKKQTNYCFKHFQKRADIYKEEKFPITISRYNL